MKMLYLKPSPSQGELPGAGSERCNIFIKCVETRTTGDERVYFRETESIGCVCVCVCVESEREILRNLFM